MIPFNLLRNVPFFAPFSEAERRAIARFAEEIPVKTGQVIFSEGSPAEALYLLVEGNIELFYRAEEAYPQDMLHEFSVGEILPGEVFGISALIDPYILNASARSLLEARLVRIPALDLRKLIEGDPLLGYVAMQQVAQVLIQRLSYTRVQLAAAWA